jgi:hypothetical protein
MTKTTPSPSSFHDKTLMRLSFGGIILASFIGTLSINRDSYQTATFADISLAVKVLGISALFSFLYLLSVAAALKYKSPAKIDRFPLTAKVSAFFYDTSVNIFGLFVIVWLTERLFHNVLHFSLTWPLIPLFLLLFSSTYFVARLVWALGRRLIEYFYESSRY